VELLSFRGSWKPLVKGTEVSRPAHSNSLAIDLVDHAALIRTKVVGGRELSAVTPATPSS
jgi:hypothetical protein